MVLSNEHTVIKERERERTRVEISYGPPVQQYVAPIQPLAPTIPAPLIPQYPPPPLIEPMPQYGHIIAQPLTTNTTLNQPAPPPTSLIEKSYPPPSAPKSYPSLNETYQQLHLGPPDAWDNPYHSEVVYDQPATPDFTHSFSSARCSAHGKIRTVQNLTKNDKGEWNCMPGSECRTVPSLGNEICSIHNKKRSLQNLVKDGSGQWVCDSRSTCITISKSIFTKEICSVHGKMRSLRYLAQRTPGVYACLVDCECYVTKHPTNVRPKVKPFILGGYTLQ